MKTIIKKSKNGNFDVYLYFKDEYTGKYKTKKLISCDTRDEAEKEKIIYQYKVDKGDISLDELNSSNVTLIQCIKEGIEKEYRRKNKKAGSTYISYDGCIDTHIKNSIGDIYISKLTARQIQDFIDEKAMNYSKSTVKKLLTIIRKGINYALQNNWIKIDPSTGIEVWGKGECPENSKKVIPYEKLRQLLTITAGTDTGLMILASATLGLRISEVLGLTWSNIDFENKTLKVSNIVTKNIKKELVLQPYTKNKEVPVFCIPDLLLSELKKYKIRWNENKIKNNQPDKDLVFHNKGKIYSPACITMRFKKILSEIGLDDLSFHSLRHTYATMLFESGVELEKISKALNHKSISVTESVYVHFTEKNSNESISVINSVFTNVV